MLRQARTAILMVIVLTIITGVIYPLVLAAPAKLFFPWQSNGSIIERDVQAIGSALIGQSFVNAETGATLPGYFRGRPSAAGQAEDGTVISSGSNLGPTNQALIDRVTTDLEIVRSENGLAADAPIPVDLVTASASGLDPQISPASAQLQVARVARERGLTPDQVQSLVDQNTQGRQLGFLGEPGVNVLLLNLALDDAAPLAPVPAPAATPVATPEA